MHQKLRFFRTGDSVISENNLKRFFDNFPEKEFWRFFVERVRYDYRQELYRKLYAKMNAVPEEQAKEIPVSEIEEMVKDVTIGHVYMLAERLSDQEVLKGLDDLFHVTDRKDEHITSLFNKHQGWLGFEDNEPGYLLNVTNGFCLMVEHLLSEQPLTLDFIKELHKTCTQGVRKMLTQTPGEFRANGASWQMDLKGDSLEGLIETINYLKSVEERMGTAGVDILIEKDGGYERISSFLNEDTFVLANRIWSCFNNGAVIYYNARENKQFDSSQFLHDVCTEHIRQLGQALDNAITKEDKLAALFTYLKHTVLHHPFQDGVGRTYSMVLLQYLLMRENFLPVLILNSNAIPGHSVKELVDEYLRAEKEMERILEEPHYISSDEMVMPNVTTEALLAASTTEDVAIFVKALTQFQEIKRSYLEWCSTQESQSSTFLHNNT